MDYQNIIEEAFAHPDLPAIVEQINSGFDRERKERQKFREWLKDNVKAEFINGEIVMHSPVKRGHLEVSENLFPLLRLYVGLNNLGIVSAEKALIALTRNDYEPDICFWKKEKTDDFHAETMIHPVPNFVVEILSKGTQKNDRGVKFKDYAAHGIEEYWMISYKKREVEQYILKNKSYKLVKIHKTSDTIKSSVITGFEIPIDAIFSEKAFLQASLKMSQQK